MEFLNKTPVAPVRLNPDLPTELKRILNKCFEKDRNLRYQHASELRADLQRLKRAKESRQIGILEEKHAKWHVSLFAAISATVLLLLLLAGFSASSLRRWFHGGAATVESLAVLPLENFSGDPQNRWNSCSDPGIPAVVTDLGFDKTSVVARDIKGFDLEISRETQGNAA